jgi:hypothetical protein
VLSTYACYLIPDQYEPLDGKRTDITVGCRNICRWNPVFHKTQPAHHSSQDFMFTSLQTDPHSLQQLTRTPLQRPKSYKVDYGLIFRKHTSQYANVSVPIRYVLLFSIRWPNVRNLVARICVVALNILPILLHQRFIHASPLYARFFPCPLCSLFSLLLRLDVVCVSSFSPCICLLMHMHMHSGRFLLHQMKKR